jgi:hypothetical protein
VTTIMHRTLQRATDAELLDELVRHAGDAKIAAAFREAMSAPRSMDRSMLVAALEQIEALPPKCLSNPLCACEICECYMSLFLELDVLNARV